MKNEAVWNSTLDGQYEATVTRTAPYQGELTISNGEKTIFRQSVGLMYNAVFGPDIADILEWKKIAVEFVDRTMR